MRLQPRHTPVHRHDAVLESFLSPFILRFPNSARLLSYWVLCKTGMVGGERKKRKQELKFTKEWFDWPTILVGQTPWSRIIFWLIDHFWPTVLKHHVVNHLMFVERLTVRRRCILAPGSCKEQGSSSVPDKLHCRPPDILYRWFQIISCVLEILVRHCWRSRILSNFIQQ